MFVDLYLAVFNWLLPDLWDYHNENGESFLHLQQCYCSKESKSYSKTKIVGISGLFCFISAAVKRILLKTHAGYYYRVVLLIEVIPFIITEEAYVLH